MSKDAPEKRPPGFAGRSQKAVPTLEQRRAISIQLRLFLRTGAALAAAAMINVTSTAVIAGPQFVVALGGYDAVAYHTENEAVAGENEQAVYWNGVTWLFSSEANRDAFEVNPAAYAPQYDGYCSYAAANGYKAPGSPLAWSVVEGRLYLNFNTRAQELWMEDVPGHVAQADKNWPKLNTH
jgi:YHS domain-containing protein